MFVQRAGWPRGYPSAMLLLLTLLACFDDDATEECPKASCRDEVVLHMVGPNGPTVTAGSVMPEDSAWIEYDCRDRQGEGWACDADGTVHVYTSASRISVQAYSTDTNAGGYQDITLSWAAAGTDECPLACEVAEATVELEAYDTACVTTDCG